MYLCHGAIVTGREVSWKGSQFYFYHCSEYVNGLLAFEIYIELTEKFNLIDLLFRFLGQDLIIHSVFRAWKVLRRNLRQCKENWE